jgi:hypothetical protein
LFIPIKINNDLQVNIIKDIESNPWALQVRGTTVRLMIREQGESMAQQYTILSESFAQRDWNPEATLNTSDLFLNYWNNSKPIGFSELDKELDSVIPSNLGLFLKFMRNIELQTTSSGWSVHKFRLRMISMLIESSEAEQLTKRQIETDLPASVDTMIDISKLLEEFSLGIQEIPTTGLGISWADEIESTINPEDLTQHSIYEEEFSDSLKQHLKDLSQNLEVTYDHPDRETQENIRWMKMSKSNKFFANVDLSSQISYGMRFYELYNKAKADETFFISGFLGKLMSLCLGRLVLQGIDTNESLVDVISESSHRTGTILSERDLDNFTDEELNQTISQIESILPMTSGYAKREMEKTLQKYKKIRLLKMSPTQTSDLESIDYSSFMIMIIQSLFENNKTKTRVSRADDNLKLSIIKAELTEFLEVKHRDGEISNHELTLSREHISRNVVSNYLIDSLCECYDMSINLGMYRYTNKEGDIEVTYN